MTREKMIDAAVRRFCPPAHAKILRDLLDGSHHNKKHWHFSEASWQNAVDNFCKKVRAEFHLIAAVISVDEKANNRPMRQYNHQSWGGNWMEER